MDENPARLWLHAYSGRENGLMVVGDRPSLIGIALSANAELLEKFALPALHGGFSYLEAPRGFLLDRVRNPDAYR